MRGGGRSPGIDRLRGVAILLVLSAFLLLSAGLAWAIAQGFAEPLNRRLRQSAAMQEQKAAISTGG